MKILFLTTGGFTNLHQSGVYTDLLRSFRNQGHRIYIVCQEEKRKKKKTKLIVGDDVFELRVRTGNITKVGYLEKGISTLFLPFNYLVAIYKYFGSIDFDIILYSTPPITLYRVIKWLKKKTNSFTYLMLKDIFPQNAIDLELFPSNIFGRMLIKYFVNIEKKFYQISDRIGCMSNANLDYLQKNNQQIPFNKIEVCPNTINSKESPEVNQKEVLLQYNIPFEKNLLIYGGNIGKPQNAKYISSVIENCHKFDAFHFIICGNGTDFYMIKDLERKLINPNFTIINNLPFIEYQKLLSCCDAGLIFLDRRFTIPNFPSRILDYMNNSLAVIAATDDTTDIKNVILEGDFGWWCSSASVEAFIRIIENLNSLESSRQQIFQKKGENAKKYLLSNYTTNIAVEKILKSYEQWKK